MLLFQEMTLLEICGWYMVNIVVTIKPFENREALLFQVFLRTIMIGVEYLSDDIMRDARE
jgi:hypothetical protein